MSATGWTGCVTSCFPWAAAVPSEEQISINAAMAPFTIFIFLYSLLTGKVNTIALIACNQKMDCEATCRTKMERSSSA
jgi:hypothetical protein